MRLESNRFTCRCAAVWFAVCVPVCVAVFFSVLQCVAVCCRVLQRVLLQRVAVCSVLQCVAVFCSVFTVWCSMLQYVAVCAAAYAMRWIKGFSSVRVSHSKRDFSIASLRYSDKLWRDPPPPLMSSMPELLPRCVCVTWLIHTCDTTHSYVWHDSFIRVTRRIHTCDMTHSCVVRCGEHVCDWMWLSSTKNRGKEGGKSDHTYRRVMSHAWIHHVTHITRAAQVSEWHDIFTCVTWLTHIWMHQNPNILYLVCVLIVCVCIVCVHIVCVRIVCVRILCVCVYCACAHCVCINCVCAYCVRA